LLELGIFTGTVFTANDGKLVVVGKICAVENESEVN